MLVHEAIGDHLVDLGVRAVFGVVGSGNFHFTQAMVERGARFVAARHEGGAATMADAYARMSDEVAVLSLHQGCGYTNAMTGITEAAKSRTPLLVLTAEATAPTSNFFIDQAAMAVAVGAVTLRVRTPRTALEDIARAYSICRDQRRTVVVNVPIDVQDMALDCLKPRTFPAPGNPAPAPQALADFVLALQQASRPVFVVGRGGRTDGARAAIGALADQVGALVATSAVSRGMFNDHPWSIDVSGGFSSPLTAELVSGADLVVGFGCALNMWTMRHGRLIADDATVIQVDTDPAALGRVREIDLGVLGGATETAAAALGALRDLDDTARSGYRSPELRRRIAEGLRWTQVAYTDASTGDRIDPRTLSSALNDLLPAERVVSVDSGNFLGYASMYLDVPDEYGFCFTQAFQSVGLGLATAVGAALAQPGRLPVAACGDGGFLMGISELETVVRLGLPMLVIVYNDAQYGAEVHHFGAAAPGMANVRFPDSDLAAIARGYGCDALSVRSLADLAPVKDWLSAGPKRPLVIDAKIVSDEGAWWLQEAFGH
ncbi:thiamine pyrophosphate-dependent acetolactate synthase large subunit-like protein [Actinocorallia herbida]|uniref:Thiamine pyrophosphate-dependent acetolactate synthase large subunit-like protein n=1 Tax=Actinocorallia herbida TaxID=58109 RepID=A0A3N1CZ05_9ACTN|nr:thiamine pyrophosphate-binding protein [Actinocorallia herbida]ROO86028.1 thiamine pyrophosphate-dependent acetolactate synthase large subunit-like protein [Actinocorallia herbida]